MIAKDNAANKSTSHLLGNLLKKSCSILRVYNEKILVKLKNTKILSVLGKISTFFCLLIDLVSQNDDLQVLFLFDS